MPRPYCSQVWRQAQLSNRIERSVRVSEFTFPGDPMWPDYGDRRNGTRGFVHFRGCLRMASCWLTAQNELANERRLRRNSVTDIALQPQQNERHRFARDTLRKGGMDSLDLSAFAAWVPKLKAPWH